MGPAFEIRLLGTFEVRDERGHALTLAVRKAEALVALLALRVGSAVAREKICGLLWPEVPEARAKQSLRQTLHLVRKALPGTLRVDSRSATLIASRVRVDVCSLEQQLARGSRDALILAARECRGELLDGLGIDEPGFEQWLIGERVRVHARAMLALTRLLELHVAAGEGIDALAVCSQALRLDPYCEPLHRQLMRLQLQLGRRTLALRHYRDLTATLCEELGTEPDAETRKLGAELEVAAADTSLGIVAAPTATPPQRPVAVPLIERRRELDLLHAARAGGAALRLLLGEAGVGKTHLCDQFAREATKQAAYVLRARCFESEQVLPFSSWLHLLLNAQLDRDPALLASLPGESRRELARLLPELGATATDRPKRAGEDVVALFRALELLLFRLAESRELVLIFDDVHWADEMSLRALGYLTRRVAGSRSGRISMLASAREEELGLTSSVLPVLIAELERDALLERVALEPFSRAQTRQLAEQWALRSRTNDPPALRMDQGREHDAWLDRVWMLSEGNALVIVESTRALTQQALSRRSRADLESLPVPERVRALILRRIDRVSGAARDVAALAATYGREVEPALLRGLVPEPQLIAALEELVAVQLVELAGECLAFTHDRIRETLYERLLPAKRQQLHGLAAKALQRLAAGHPREAALLGQAGFHHARAGDAEAAIPLLVRFAQHARNTYGLTEAIAALAQARAVADRLPVEGRAFVTTFITLHQAYCLTFAGRIAELVETLIAHSSQIASVSQRELHGPFHFWLGFGLAFTGRIEEAEVELQRALQSASEHGDVATCGAAHILLAWCSAVSCRCEQGALHGMQAERLLREHHAGRPEPIVFACLNTVLNLVQSGEWQRALDEARKAELLAQSSGGSARARAAAAVASALVRASIQRWAEALEDARRGLAASDAAFTRVLALWISSRCHAGLGELEQAREHLAAAMTQADALGIAAWHAEYSTTLAELTLQAGDYAAAKRLAIAARARTESTGDRRSAARALTAQALAEHGLGELAPAWAHVQQALREHERHALPLDIAETWIAVAQIARGQDPSRAEEALRRARAIYDARSLDHLARVVDSLSSACAAAAAPVS